MCKVHILRELPFYAYKGKFTFYEARKGKRCHRDSHCRTDNNCILGHPASSSAAYCCHRGDSVSSLCARVVGALHVDESAAGSKPQIPKNFGFWSIKLLSAILKH